MAKFVKANIEILNKLIDQFDTREAFLRADGNESAAQYNAGIAEGLRRVRNGDFS